MTPIPLDPKEFRTLLVQTAATFMSGDKCKDGMLQCYELAKHLLEAAGIVEGVEEQPIVKYVCGCNYSKDYTRNACPTHSKPATCLHPVNGTYTGTAAPVCGRPVPCSIHG